MVTLETCKGPECINRGRRRTGLCDQHAKQLPGPLRPLRKAPRTSADVAARDEQGCKHCPNCERWLTLSEFWADPNVSDGLRLMCKLCQSIRYHGLTFVAYTTILERQGGTCAGCGSVPEDGFQVDHDHGCCAGQNGCSECVRGLLCGGCNRALGMVNDDVETLRRLVAYLGQTQVR